ncbi:SHOCT domain-containing protein [Virgibacillus sp. DJP39]|uniref:SHOCT domain-containing protein n=1 Tax=Virgibacillus sp. DJP39 TaxID=3409790 RepID=UPI003BB4C5D7
MSMMGGSMILNMVLWIIVLGFVIYGIVLLISKPFEKKENTSIQILKERFAQGEIDAQEYDDKKARLKNEN